MDDLILKQAILEALFHYAVAAGQPENLSYIQLSDGTPMTVLEPIIRELDMTEGRVCTPEDIAAITLHTANFVCEIIEAMRADPPASFAGPALSGGALLN